MGLWRKLNEKLYGPIHYSSGRLAPFVEVRVQGAKPVVYMSIQQRSPSGDGEFYRWLEFTPAVARRMASGLVEAADVLETRMNASAAQPAAGNT